MKPNPHAAEPRARVIFRHTDAALRATGMNLQLFATTVSDTYQARVAELDRVVDFHVGTTTEQIVKAEKANLQLVTRFLRGVVKLPADLEESWVASLPEPFRTDCARELAQRYGFIGARMPATGIAAQTLSAAGVTLEVGHLLQEIAQVMADHEVNAADLPALRRAVKEVGDTSAELASLHATLEREIERLQQELADLAAAAQPLRAVR